MLFTGSNQKLHGRHICMFFKQWKLLQCFGMFIKLPLKEKSHAAIPHSDLNDNY